MVRKEFQSLCERKMEEKREGLLEEAKRAKTQMKVWDVINRERGKRMEINEEIEMSE